MVFGFVSEESLVEETVPDLLPSSESPREEQAAHHKDQGDAWSVEDVQLEFFDINCMPEQREEVERKPEVTSSQTSCSNCLTTNQGPVIDAEERALLNLLKFDNSVPRGSRWNASGVSRRYVTLVGWPKRGDEDKERHRDKVKKRTRMEKTSSMLERLQSCLNRAEAQKAAAASLDRAKALEGKPLDYFAYCLGFKRFKNSLVSVLQTFKKLVRSRESTAEKLSFEWSHFRISSTDSKVRTTL